MFGKYAGWARSALERGDAARARGHVSKLRELNPESPEVAELEAGIARLENEAAELEPGRVFRDCPSCPEMVVVPAGTFSMGSPTSEEGRFSTEGPVRRVTIAEPFAVGKYEVTRGEFSRFVEATGHSTGDSCRTLEGGEWEDRRDHGWRNPGYRQDGRHPVACVNWDDAKAYARWLSEETGESYRLLSEAEWEYAARAGTATRYSWGDEVGRNRANCQECGSRWDDESTAPAGSFAANGFGLHDMHGNVQEWVEDCSNDGYAGAPSDGSAWTQGFCSVRVLRGGSWDFPAWILRSANRLRLGTGERTDFIGFRVARTLAR